VKGTYSNVDYGSSDLGQGFVIKIKGGCYKVKEYSNYMGEYTGRCWSIPIETDRLDRSDWTPEYIIECVKDQNWAPHYMTRQGHLVQ
jgi:hypothetical protein